MTKSAFLGGALSFKGDKKKSRKKSKKTKSKHKLKDVGTVAELSGSSPQHRGNDDRIVDEFPASSDDDELTEAERKALKFRKLRQKDESEKIARQSHRERVEALNEKLGNMTELNDIPRVSAAGNG